MNAPWSCRVALIATIAAVVSGGCNAGTPTGSPVAATPSSFAAAQPGSSAVATASVEVSPSVQSPSVQSPSAEPTAVAASDAPDSIDGTAGPGCGTGAKGYFAHFDEVPKTIQFGGATIEYTIVSVSLRNGTYAASDSVPGWIGLTPTESAVVVGPGDHIVLRAKGLTLTATSARVVPWKTLTFENGPFSAADWVELAWRHRADGSLSISAPAKVGDYAVEFGPGWTGTCVAGSGLAYGRIKVR